MCPANCKIYAGQDPRCPCSAYPLHPSCPPNCESYAGKDKRCPCSEFPLHKNCPPNCDVYTGKEYIDMKIVKTNPCGIPRKLKEYRRIGIYMLYMIFQYGLEQFLFQRILIGVENSSDCKNDLYFKLSIFLSIFYCTL